MDTKAAIIALLTVWGVGAAGCIPAAAEDTAIDGDVDTDSDNPLLNKVWIQQGDTASPGAAQIFLADGTLVTDSCWETYRLSKWQQVSDTAISWDEDGMTINADIVSVSPSELVLNLHLVSENVEQRFVLADVPYVCPDMPK
ncbi:hypothetical protein DevBK_03525 [Devosia sp. BK]|uniref:hypothetical protein n=1 Tax=unclassified Devosia TaxID=196773 RepID=UPI0007130967|nr:MULTISPECIES: hypothetical protein [unclassified Devosia]KQT44766.1 hypothetical protein ASG47_15130 [Devosia sp. Leaf420]MDV3250399.1 hypothetical protein [Devosia sp. BK]